MPMRPCVLLTRVRPSGTDARVYCYAILLYSGSTPEACIGYPERARMDGSGSLSEAFAVSRLFTVAAG